MAQTALFLIGLFVWTLGSFFFEGAWSRRKDARDLAIARFVAATVLGVLAFIMWAIAGIPVVPRIW